MEDYVKVTKALGELGMAEPAVPSLLTSSHASHGALTVMVTAVKPALCCLTGAKVGCRRAKLQITLRLSKLAPVPK